MATDHLDYPNGKLQIIDCTSYVADTTFTSDLDQRVLDNVTVYTIYWVCEVRCIYVNLAVLLLISLNENSSLSLEKMYTVRAMGT